MSAELEVRNRYPKANVLMVNGVATVFAGDGRGILGAGLTADEAWQDAAEKLK